MGVQKSEEWTMLLFSFIVHIDASKHVQVVDMWIIISIRWVGTGWCNGKLGGIEASLNTDLNPGDWCGPPPVSPARLMRVNC